MLYSVLFLLFCCTLLFLLLCSTLLCFCCSSLRCSFFFCSTLFCFLCSVLLCSANLNFLLCCALFPFFFSTLPFSVLLTLLCSTLFPFFCSTLPTSILLTLLCCTPLCSVYSPHRQSRTINATFYLSIDYAVPPRLRVQFHRSLSQTQSSSDFQSPAFNSLWV